MGKYVVKRVLLAIITIFIVCVITFFTMNAIPGGPFAGEKAKSPEVQAALEKRFGPSKVYILVCYTEQTDFLDMHGERADDVSSILGVYSTKEEAETQRAEYETTLNASEYVNSWTQIIEKTLDKPVC